MVFDRKAAAAGAVGAVVVLAGLLVVLPKRVASDS